MALDEAVTRIPSVETPQNAPSAIREFYEDGCGNGTLLTIEAWRNRCPHSCWRNPRRRHAHINRPESRNPLGEEGDGDLFAGAAAEINADRSLRCVVLQAPAVLSPAAM
jgi:hypothetical protein